MANKVLSIKMDETDIQRLKTYFAFLKSTGVITESNLTFNGFLKHLLLDNLDHEFMEMTSSLEEMGLGFRFINSTGINLINSYNLNEDEFTLYKRAIETALKKRGQEMQKEAEDFFEFMNMDYYENKGQLFTTFKAIPKTEDVEKGFWIEKALELQERSLEVKDELKSDIEWIEESDLSEEEKKQIIRSMMASDEIKKQERMLKRR